MTFAQYDNRLVDALSRSVNHAVNRLSPFYRANPYRGPLWITEVDMRVAVSLSHGFLFNRLPKNANSTVTAMLHDYAFGGQGDAMARTAKHAFGRPVFLGRRGVAALADCFKFCIVRDPYSRTLSAYLDKIVGRQRQSRRPLRLLRDKHGTDAPTFEQFCLYLAEGGLYDDNHWAPQVAGLVLPPERFDHIGRFERLDEELDLIARRIFGRGYASERRYGPASTDAAAQLEAHYTPRAREIVQTLFRPDFETFGYPV
ncbi:sulfotransferase family protein [Psychromarinibacter sp. C21-152]|uniref:Sulfotransferase family protein n=1 Tax=Psychromarinibacter sediminicola TaxID=3033385 RepID=A0AAE3NPU9_9RHOB|nr:sulfotransferase family protein [Psychromarinibacter sediminicola]MDF0601318.1 sulfotransferase family protein [Psychromarinibacter sediminicola]